MGTAADLAAVVLAAGAGTRLAPLTLRRPKPLCPVGNVALLDHALERLEPLGLATAVNAHHHAEALRRHLSERPVHVSIEPDRALGTAGALGWLAGWLDGRGALVVNGDTWTDLPLGDLVADWDGEQPRVLVVGDEGFGPGSRVAGSLVPWGELRRLPTEPTGLWEACWRPAWRNGSLAVVEGHGGFVDCGTPVGYLRANDVVRAASVGDASLVAPGARGGGSVLRSVVGDGAVVEGAVVDSVVWPGAQVAAGERLERAVRTDDGRTLLVR